MVTYIVNRSNIPNPANRSNKYIGQLQIFDGLSERHSVLLTKLDLLLSIRAAA